GLPEMGLKSAVPPATVPPSPARPEMVDLSAEKRAELIALVEGNARLPADAKARLLAQLAQDQVPAQVIERLQRRRVGG
ncbi:MAG: efflux transporter periplasmic adaptor subunit, partial [Paracoccaceae bacterium]|nr:efflux transporter periplasmic adaptor subunit [Paracoccaceae bacterium]